VKLQTEGHETRQGVLVQGGGEGCGACVAHMHKVPRTDRTAESEQPAPSSGPAAPPAPSARHRLPAAVEHAVGAGCWACFRGRPATPNSVLERWHHRAQRVPSNARLVSYRPATAIKEPTARSTPYKYDGHLLLPWCSGPTPLSHIRPHLAQHKQPRGGGRGEQAHDRRHAQRYGDLWSAHGMRPARVRR
jgi:hypothetical protein